MTESEVKIISNTPSGPVVSAVKQKKVSKDKPVKDKKEKKEKKEKKSSSKTVSKSSKTEKKTSGTKLSKKTKKEEPRSKSSTFIPVPKIKRHINNDNINKFINEQLEKIKGAKKDKLDLSKILSSDSKKMIDEYIQRQTKLEEKMDKSARTLHTKTPYEIACSVFLQHKVKFSNTSFQVVAKFMDSIISDIIYHSAQTLHSSSNKTLNTKMIVKEMPENGSLYSLYSNTKTYREFCKASDHTDESTETDEVVEESHDDTNAGKLKYYVRQMILERKKFNTEHKELYEDIKISDKFCDFCSRVVVDLLDDIVIQLQFLIDTVYNKTINEDVFKFLLMSMMSHRGIEDVRSFL